MLGDADEVETVTAGEGGEVLGQLLQADGAGGDLVEAVGEQVVPLLAGSVSSHGGANQLNITDQIRCVQYPRAFSWDAVA
jgi:hypothetical protein